MTSRSLLWPVVLIASAVCVALLVWGDVKGPVRVVVVAGFLLVCPGMAVVRRVGVADKGTEVVLATAVSIGLEAILAGALLYVGWWSPSALLVVLVALCLVAGADELVMAHQGNAAGHRTVTRAGTGGER